VSRDGGPSRDCGASRVGGAEGSRAWVSAVQARAVARRMGGGREQGRRRWVGTREQEREIGFGGGARVDFVSMEFFTVQAHHRRFVTPTGSDVRHHRRFMARTGGDAL